MSLAGALRCLPRFAFRFSRPPVELLTSAVEHPFVRIKNFVENVPRLGGIFEQLLCSKPELFICRFEGKLGKFGDLVCGAKSVPQGRGERRWLREDVDNHRHRRSEIDTLECQLY
jgi:hypothetical protein